jgi:hypothetical protein
MEMTFIHKALAERYEGKRLLGPPMLMWEGDTKINFKQMKLEFVDLTELRIILNWIFKTCYGGA